MKKIFYIFNSLFLGLIFLERLITVLSFAINSEIRFEPIKPVPPATKIFEFFTIFQAIFNYFF